MLLPTRRERRLEGLLVAASAVGLALLANHCVPDVQIAEQEPDAGTGGAAGAAGQAGAVNTGGTETGTPGLIGGPCLEGDEGDIFCTVGRCSPSNSRCITGEYGDPCQENGHCVGNHCDVQSAGGAGGAGGAPIGTCAKYPAWTSGCKGDDECISGSCTITVCDPGIDGAACYTDNDCDLDNCFEGTCRLKPPDDDCDPEGGGNADCLSGDCHPVLRTCQLGAGDTPCTTDADCMTGTCTGDSSTATCVAPVVVAQTQWPEFALRADPDYLDVEFRIVLRGEGPVPLSELAFIYFYYLDSDRTQQLADIPATGILTADEFAVEVTGSTADTNWRMMATTFATTLELTSLIPDTGDIYVRVESDPPLGGDQRYDQAVDYSWPEGGSDTAFESGFNDNSRTVICRNVGGSWQREWGNSPAQFPDPCSLL